MDVFEAKLLAEQEVEKIYENTCCVQTKDIVVVSAERYLAMIVPNENTAYNSGCKFVFDVRYNHGKAIAVVKKIF